MPVEFKDGRLYGEEGCYADRGRLMAAIYYDIKCNIGYFATSFMFAWAGNRQPGCLWNYGGYNKGGGNLREIMPETFRTRYVDVEMLAPDYLAVETKARPQEDWGKPGCPGD
jgi:hypothetical protein